MSTFNLLTYHILSAASNSKKWDSKVIKEMVLKWNNLIFYFTAANADGMKKDADGIANSEDSDQTAPLGAV